MWESAEPMKREFAWTNTGERVDAAPAARSLSEDERMRPAEPPMLSRRAFLATAGSALAMMAGPVPLVGAEAGGRTKVGFIMPESGPLADEARSLTSGFDLFLKENDKPAPPLEILKRDPGPEEEKTLEAVTSLVVGKEVRFLIGPLSLAASEHTVRAVADGKTILFVTNQSVRLVAGELCRPQSFRVGGNTLLASRPLAPWAVKNLGLKGFLTGADDWKGNEEADFFAFAFERAGGTFIDRIMISESGDEMKSVLEGVRTGKPDFVFASFRGPRAISFLKRFQKASPTLTQTVIGPESLVEYPRTLFAEKKTAEGIKTLTTLKNPKELVERIKEKLGRDITHASRAAEGYDVAAIICEALRKTAGDQKDFAGLITAVEKTLIDGPRGKVRFDKNHEPILQVSVQKWELEGGSLQRTILDDLGACSTPDMGCGKVGFPKRPELEPEEEREPDQGHEGD